MSVRERAKGFKGRAKEKFRWAFGSSPAQSIHSSPNDPPPTTGLMPESSAVSTAPASNPPNLGLTGVNDSWTNLGRFLQVLSRGSSGFGPLGPVMDELAGCISMHEGAATARQGYEALKTELESLFGTLSTHFSSGVPPAMTASMDNLCGAIERELDSISNREERGTGGRHWEAQKDLGEVMECYCRILGHVDRLTINADLSTWKIVDEQATETRLKTLTPSLSAYYNSAEAALVRRRECTPNTREQVLSDLSTWRHDNNQGNIYWLNGMAGTGKTTIASSLCTMLDKSHELGASFFCTRQLPECRNVKMILPTIAYQLARFSRPFRCALSRALERDPDVHARALPNQLEGMIMNPLRDVAHTLPTNLVIVIDALDECEDGDRVGEILGLLLKHASNLPIKVFVSSRPEPQIRQKLSSMKSQLILHELDDKIVNADIEVYLRAELEDVSISDSQMSRLVERAGVLFIYAATVVRYIKAEDFYLGQQKRLNVVLGALPATSSNKDKDIDALYSAVLASAFGNPDLEDPDKERMRLILHTVVCVQEPLTVNALAGLLHLEHEDWVRAALRPLWSVLHISGSNSLVNTLHASFPDFILNPQRSNEHSCDAKEHHGRLAEQCFARVRNNERQFNICQLESSYVFDVEVPDLEDRVKREIPLDLMYACQYWAVHLELGGPSSTRVKQLDEFLLTELLLWVEVLNLGKRMNVGPTSADKARRWCINQDGASDTKDLAHDAWRFVTTFAANPISRSTPHVYVSMLASWPSSRPIAVRYIGRTKRLVNVAGTAMERRDVRLLAVIKAGSRVASVAFSPDGSRVVSASDKTIQVWDAQAGQMVLGPLEGHTEWVSSVAFSADGMRIVSGSGDKTIRVWDAQTGQTVLEPLQGHADWVCSVAFSPDGTRIVSGSNDETMQVWDAQSGQMVLGPLEGHDDPVSSVAFSPDGRRIVSASGTTIRVWDAQTGQIVMGPPQKRAQIGPIEEGRWHQMVKSAMAFQQINSVAFSPNGLRIVSGSCDNQVKVWDAQTGQMVLGSDWVYGECISVCSVAFSPDGTRIVSGSSDKTIEVCDAQTGGWVLGPLEGHTGSVSSVAFSPDGTRIVSGSDDTTIRLWDAQTEQTALGPLQGHTELVFSVSFSLDGTRVVSGSGDCTIQVWDAQTGQMVLGPLKGHTDSVSSVAFSPDSLRIVSGSSDRTIRVWDAQTGQMVLGPLDWHSDPVSSIALSPDGSRIASCSEDQTIQIWDAQTGWVVLGPLEGHANCVSSAAFSPDGLRIVSGSWDRTIRVWDAQTGQTVLGPLEGHIDIVTSVAFSPDGKRVASGSYDKTVRVWDVQTGQMAVGPLEGHTDQITSVAFSPSNLRIVSGSYDKAIRVWDAETGHMVMGPLEGHTGFIYSVVFSPDGTRIVSGSYDKTIRAWDAQSGQMAVGPPQRHTDLVPPAALLPDNVRVASSSSVTIQGCVSPYPLTPMSPIAPTSSMAQTQNPIPSSAPCWKLNQDGWVIDQQQHILLWVPHDLRDRLLILPNTLIMSAGGSVQLQFDHAAIGEAWTECYSPA